MRSETDAPRTLWNTKVNISRICLCSVPEHIQISNAALQDRIASFGTGILRLAGLQAQESNVLLLLNDCIGTYLRTYYLELVLLQRIQSSSLLIWHCLHIPSLP